MGTSRMNIMLRDHACVPITNCWLLDLVLQTCSGTPLFEVFPIVKQLKDRYAKSAVVSEATEWPLATDQATKTLQLTIGGGSPQTLVFASPAMTQMEVYSQMKGFFTGCEINIVDGHITITTDDKGPSATIAIAGDCDLVWGPVEQGSGYQISTRLYRSAYRIKIQPPSGEYINHLEVDVPTGCYKVRGRVCHGKNEETSTVMAVVETCGECYAIDLLLPEVMNCAQDIMYPFVDKVANDYQQFLPNQADRVVVFKAIALAANIGREQILVELADRKQDAEDINRPDLMARVDEMIAIAQLLPQCC